jgi:hypothetical protein
VDGSRSKRLDVPNGSHRDIQMGRRQRKIGQQGDAKPCGDERARDRDVADFMGDVGLEAASAQSCSSSMR